MKLPRRATKHSRDTLSMQSVGPLSVFFLYLSSSLLAKQIKATQICEHPFFFPVSPPFWDSRGREQRAERQASYNRGGGNNRERGLQRILTGPERPDGLSDKINDMPVLMSLGCTQMQKGASPCRPPMRTNKNTIDEKRARQSSALIDNLSFVTKIAVLWMMTAIPNCRGTSRLDNTDNECDTAPEEPLIDLTCST